MFHWNSGCYPCSRYCYKGKCDKWTGVCNYHKCDDGSRYSEDFRCLRTCTKGWYGENCGRPCGKCLLDTCHPQHGLCYKGDKLGYSLRDEFFKAVDLNEPWNDSSLVRFHGWCEHMIEVKENKITFANVSDRDFVVQGETKASSLDDIRSSAGFNYRGPRCEYRSGSFFPFKRC
ncbi:hypothetical protein C0Q70_16816 [Pomacea canaliculata]|uniref:Scavenger receptor class F member 2 n=1 Tax=Pomacea canaliculata TaxID=400727 RepID=A0A2T7NQU3_POMCA|nr:hypothetical protein C0Q70_16816 [Pomacea canaliculata]